MLVIMTDDDCEMRVLLLLLALSMVLIASFVDGVAIDASSLFDGIGIFDDDDDDDDNDELLILPTRNGEIGGASGSKPFSFLRSR